MDCYGTYSKHKKQCPNCDKLPWCRDAGDIKPEDHVELDKVAFSEQCAIQPDFAESADECAKCAVAMAKCVRELLALEKQSPLRFHILMVKLSNPELAYSGIAEKFGIDKQLVQYHLRIAISIFPELGRAVLINRRYNPGKPGILKKSGQRVNLKMVAWKHWGDLTMSLPGF